VRNAANSSFGIQGTSDRAEGFSGERRVVVSSLRAISEYVDPRGRILERARYLQITGLELAGQVTFPKTRYGPAKTGMAGRKECRPPPATDSTVVES
jgi:hypothetical protein